MTRPVSRASMVIAAFSTIVEWYDFTLYFYFATVISRLFFGPGEAALLTTLGGFAIAYLARPFGAVFFGHIGDRHGRRRMMLASMALMSLAMFLTALLPTRASVGPLAPALLLVLRCIMGFSVGGEYTGVVAYLMEGAPAHRRGLITALAAAASEVGGLLAVAVSAATIALTSEASLAAWGWRIPFLVGSLLAALTLVARATLDESPDFERQQAAGTVPASPLRYSLTHHRAGIVRGFAISALGSITYYVGITYVPTFLTSAGKLGEGPALWLSTAAAVMVIAVTPFVGLASDRFGRRPILVILALLAAALPLILFGLMASGSAPHALLGALALAAVAGGVSAVGAVTTAEQFTGEGRLSGLAFGATAATAIFGGLTPWLAQYLIARTGWPLVPGAMIAIVALCVLPVLWMLPETAPGRTRSVHR